MKMLTQHDFETAAGQRRILSTINTLETKVRELDRLVHECREREQALEFELDGYATHAH